VGGCTHFASGGQFLWHPAQAPIQAAPILRADPYRGSSPVLSNGFRWPQPGEQKSSIQRPRPMHGVSNLAQFAYAPARILNGENGIPIIREGPEPSDGERRSDDEALALLPILASFLVVADDWRRGRTCADTPDNVSWPVVVRTKSTCSTTRLSTVSARGAKVRLKERGGRHPRQLQFQPPDGRRAICRPIVVAVDPDGCVLFIRRDALDQAQMSRFLRSEVSCVVSAFDGGNPSGWRLGLPRICSGRPISCAPPAT